jgi:hypothetical protein
MNILKISVYERYGLCDRMGDGFVDPPNRYKWTFDQLYQDWNAHGFFNELRKKGYITVSYAGNPFIDYVPSAEKNNRHQVLTLALFLDTQYYKDNVPVIITSPHESGDGNFVVKYQRVSESEIMYTTQSNNIVRFRFDSYNPSQI